MPNSEERLVCKNCDCEINNGDFSFEEDVFCEDCWRALFINCRECGVVIIPNSNKKYDGEYYCNDCWRESYTTCCSCSTGIRYDEDDYRESEGGDSFCDSCYWNHYTRCEHCDMELSLDDAYRGDDMSYCQGCWEDRFASCHECGQPYRRDNMRYVEEDDEFYCERCYGHGRLIHDYTYTPTFEFKKMPWENTLYLGVELEVEPENESESVRIVEKLTEYLKKERVCSRFYFKHDGSVNGFELVTHPFTLQYAHKKLKFNKILKWLKKAKCTSYESGRCGLHIHMNRDFFQSLDIAKLRIFFTKNKEKLRKFSERQGQGEKYCNYESFELRKFLRNKNQEGRYWAFNLNTNKNTVELRLFRGTLDERRFIASMQFADAIAHFVKAIGLNSLIIGERSYKDNSWKLFYDWTKSKKRYTQLVQYLEKENLCA